MSAAAVMMVKDEVDIVEYTVRHLAEQVDEVIVADNLSTDGTAELLRELCKELPLSLIVDDEVGYWQSKKMTALAMMALERGHRWVVPCDADEWWHVPDPSRRIEDYLAGLSPEIQVVPAHLYYHLPSALDPPDEPNPYKRIGFRKREHQGLHKVACKLRPDLVIHAGNHSASTMGTGTKGGMLKIRHFSWRTEDQYLHKIRVGEEAYAATDLPLDIGAHWREGRDDDFLRGRFREWFWSSDPHADDELIYDPAP